MADRWTLITATGNYLLNASFSAPKLHAGGVDTNAALRRDGLRTYQRTGDGLRTPGPLILKGRVWRDDQSIPALVDELDDITDAVAATIQVRRENDAGTYTYRQLAGGPPPVMTPDGLGGWEVEISLWPGEASPLFIPLHVDSHLYVYYDTSGSISSGDLDNLRLAIDDVIVQLQNGGVAAENIHEADSMQERYLQWFVQSQDDYVVIAFVNEATPDYHGATTDTGPTANWTTDYNAFREHLNVEGRRFRAVVYAMEPASATGQPERVVTFNDLHIPHAVPGTNGYPNNPSLADLGVSYRVNVSSGEASSVYLDDIWTALGG